MSTDLTNNDVVHVLEVDSNDALALKCIMLTYIAHADRVLAKCKLNIDEREYIGNIRAYAIDLSHEVSALLPESTDIKVHIS